MDGCMYGGGEREGNLTLGVIYTHMQRWVR